MRKSCRNQVDAHRVHGGNDSAAGVAFRQFGAPEMATRRDRPESLVRARAMN